MEEIELKILAYLSSNPEAGDTVSGIAEWWLAEEGIRSKVGEVERALAGLVSRDLVIQRAGLDGCVRYELNARYHGGVEHLLRRHAVVAIGKERAEGRPKEVAPSQRRRGRVGQKRGGKRA